MNKSAYELTNKQNFFEKDFPGSGYVAPQKIEEVLEILSKYGKEIKIIAGGTDLLVQYYDRLYEVSAWLDLKNIEELKEIKIDQNQIEIGAMATHTQLESSADIKRYYPVLSQAASDIGSPQIRNRGTIGGNIVNASPAGDLLPALIAYRAQFKLVSHKEESIVSAEDFFLGPKKTILKPEQLLSKIVIPIPEQNTYSSWIKIGKRKALIVATVSLALVISMAEDNKIIKEVRVCLGSVAPTPFEIMEIREKMIGRQFNQLDFNELGQLVEDRISPIDDIRGTKEYRQDVTKNIMINVLKKIYETWRQSRLDD